MATDIVLAAASGHVLTAEQREEHKLGYDDFWVETGLSKEALDGRPAPGAFPCPSPETFRVTSVSITWSFCGARA